MPEMAELVNELRGVQFGEYHDIFSKFNALAEKYNNLPSSAIIDAFGKATGRTFGTNDRFERNDPYVQNRRVKAISSLPANYSKDKVAEMIVSADANEQPLRQVEHGLEYTAYPLFHTRKTYQDLLTYHSYFSPQYAEEKDVKKDDFWREWKLLEKLRNEMEIGATTHMIVGQALQEGKVFYVPRVDVDKPHNKVNHAFMQQLPSDWTKIVGLNNKSKYTVAVNLFYFLEPGTDPRQYGDLFLPYIGDFTAVVNPAPKGVGKTVVYASKTGVDMARLRKMQDEREMTGDPDVYYQNGRWYYWVTLPVDRVFTFEVDDVSRTAVSPFTGLFISMMQLAQYEQVQLELVQNPLISIVTGEIPYREDKAATTSDAYKLSNAGREFFEAIWYQMLMENNTNGVGLFMAPIRDIRLHQLAEAPSAMQISTNGYAYTMAKAGLSAIIPTTEEPRAGIAQISLMIESKFAQPIYRGIERMFRVLIQKLNLKYDWKFIMFGDIATDAELEDTTRQAMTLGILPATIVYNALHDRSIFDDISISAAIKESGLLDNRLPLVSTYSAKNPDSGLPPEVAHDLNPGGRPEIDEADTDGQEDDLDIGE